MLRAPASALDSPLAEASISTAEDAAQLALSWETSRPAATHARCATPVTNHQTSHQPAKHRAPRRCGACPDCTHMSTAGSSTAAKGTGSGTARQPEHSSDQAPSVARQSVPLTVPAHPPLAPACAEVGERKGGCVCVCVVGGTFDGDEEEGGEEESSEVDRENGEKRGAAGRRGARPPERCAQHQEAVGHPDRLASTHRIPHLPRAVPPTINQPAAPSHLAPLATHARECALLARGTH